MSTRARAVRSTSLTGANVSPSAIKTRKQQQQRQDDVDDTAMNVDGEKKATGNATAKAKVIANGRGTATKKAKAALGKKAKEEKALESVDCLCSKGDDGSPMILCSECKIWYHFTCVDITEPQAEEINVYICPTCTKTTGRRSAMRWEGEQAVEECSDDDATIVQRRTAVLKSRSEQKPGNLDKKPRKHQDARMVEPIKFEAEESEEMDDSEDEYVEENGPKKLRRSQARLRKLSTTTSTSDDGSDSGTKRRRVTRVRPNSPSRSPSVPHATKRKAKSISVGKGSSPAPPPKRKRSGTTAGSEGSTSALDDPVRKYCLGKLQEMFKEVYLRYPYVRLKEEEEQGEEGETGNKLIKKLSEMNEEEKEALIEDSKRFANELEMCVYEIYAEPDKTGSQHAGPKYKDRFRTLQFNLSKPDRVVVHQRITSGNLSAKEISVMSSTDLADEEMKQSIIQAEKESLEHSILQRQTAPRAKITHKGLQDIEDVRGEGSTSQEFDLEKERQQEEEERRERERLARLRTATAQTHRQRTASISVPPESPTVPPSSAISLDGHHQEQWGAPPPVPLHAMVSSPTDETGHGQRAPLFTSEFVAEPELNLGDFINIDEDPDGPHANTTVTTTEDGPNDQTRMAVSPTEGTFPIQSPVSLTGISPFAQRPEKPQGPSFNLNSLWNEQAPVDPGGTVPIPTAAEEADKAKVVPTTTEDKEPKNVTASGDESRDDSDNMELESVEANDQDFDMFLADETEAAGSEPVSAGPTTPPSVDSLPQVWVGKITMPLDSGVPQETNLVARQIGGKPLPADSPLWNTLFPSEMLRIEGRVPVDNSVKYLVQMRLNPTKELYGVVLAPAEPQNENDFNAFNNFLISKSRHGLVFPWGARPKEYHPGRELYMIPLLQTQPLPEFVELLDDLKLPAIRTRDYLVGVWILNKGKLAPPPGQPSQPVPPVQPQVIPNLQSIPALPNNGSAPQIPPLGILSGMLPTSSNPAALAAEVASLTPEQVQNLLRTLTTQGQPPLLPGQQPPSVAQLLGHSAIQSPIGQPPFPPPAVSSNQSWPGAQQVPPPSTFPMGFPPPPNMPFQHPPSQSHHPHHSYDHHQGPDRRDSMYDRDYRFGPDRDRDYNNDRGDRGGWRGGHGRGRGGGRGGGGRGRGGDGYHDRDRDFRPRDSGWPRKPRNEGHQEGSSW